MRRTQRTIQTILAASIFLAPISAFAQDVAIQYRVSGEKWSRAFLVTNGSSLKLTSSEVDSNGRQARTVPIVTIDQPKVTGVNISGKHPTPYLALVATALSGVLLFVHDDASKQKASGIAGVVSSLIALLHKKSEIHTITDENGLKKIQIKLTKKNREALERLHLR